MSQGIIKGISDRLLNYRELLYPVVNLTFSRPLVIIQSDDWGLVGIKNKAALDRIVADHRLNPESSHWDYYGLETTEDLAALCNVLGSHQDSSGYHPVMGCNFILANVDFRRVEDSGFEELFLKPLHDGFPWPWDRQGLVETYREAIKQEYLYPSLHGVTHFCYPAVQRLIREKSHRGELLRSFFQIGTPLAYQHSPWVGHEFMDWEQGWLSFPEQREIVAQGVALFQQTFGRSPVSACAPGYRANRQTFRAWHQHGIQVVQNGPGVNFPPFIGHHGLLYLHRNVSFEPAIDQEYFTTERAFQNSVRCVKAGQPIILCMHSVNFHSRLRNFRDLTLTRLDQLLTRLESAFPDLLYIHDEELWNIIQCGYLKRHDKVIQIKFTKKLGISAIFKQICLQKIRGKRNNDEQRN